MEDHGLPTTHSTIIHGYKKAKESIDNDKDYADFIHQMKYV